MPLGAARFGLSGADLGKLELIETQTISGTVAQVDFTSIKESTYNVHLLMLSNMLTETDGKRVTLRFFESGVIETASVYEFANFVLEAGGSQANVNNTGSNDIRITDNTGNDTGESSNTLVYLYNLGDSSKYSFITCQSSAIKRRLPYDRAPLLGVRRFRSMIGGLVRRGPVGPFLDPGH